jgi:multidrug transporter EmrE-like cation transporter
MEFIAGMVTVEAVGDYNLARYAKEGRWWQLGTGYGAYAILLAMFIKAIKEKGLLWANTAWDGWSNIATGLVALVLLGERPTGKELAGIALVSAGLFLLGTRGTLK